MVRLRRLQHRTPPPVSVCFDAAEAAADEEEYLSGFEAPQPPRPGAVYSAAECQPQCYYAGPGYWAPPAGGGDTHSPASRRRAFAALAAAAEEEEARRSSSDESGDDRADSGAQPGGSEACMYW